MVFTAALLAAMPLSGFSAESEPAKYPGIAELCLGTDVQAIRPGEKFTVGLLFRHEPHYHTYWRSPGIVGVGATIKWELPEGFEAGEIQWPAPQKTIMATWTAYGYETDTCLLIPIKAPAKISPDLLDEHGAITLKGRAGWMACADSCHPGWHDVSLRLKVNRDPNAGIETDEKWRKLFENSRARYPVAAPEGWKFSVERKSDTEIRLTAEAPADLKAGTDDWSGVYFFCDDRQIDSHSSQEVKPLPDGKPGFVMELKRAEYAPEDPKIFSGVLHRPGGWPGLDRPWMKFSLNW